MDADRTARVRAQIEAAVRDLDKEIGELVKAADDAGRDVEFARAQRAQLAKILELEPAVFAYVIDVLEVKFDAHR